MESQPEETDERVEIAQRKIIAVLATGDFEVLKAEKIEENAEQRAEIYQKLNTAEISRAELKRIVMAVVGETDAAAVFEKMQNSPYQRRLLAYATGVGFNNYMQVEPSAVERFWELFPNPVDFEPVGVDLLEIIERNNSVEKYWEYQKAVKEFTVNLYGEKQLFWDQMEVLKRLAFKTGQKEVADELMGRAKIPEGGDGWRQNGQDFYLSLDAIRAAGLEPRHEVKIGGVRIGLSAAFMVGTRMGVLAFVDMGSVWVRSYYRSGSAGLWRYLPDYVMEKEGEISHYGTGYFEESLTLPTVLQRELNKIAKWDVIELTNYNPGFFLAGSLKRYGSEAEYWQARAENKLTGDFYREVEQLPVINYGVSGQYKNPPQRLMVTGERAPNFRKVLADYGSETEAVGRMRVREFASMDGSLKYLMCETREKGERRAWLGGVEVNASITSTGCKAQWALMGDLATPLFEHEKWAGGYGDPAERRGEYVSMWKNYLSRAPLIKQYLYTTK